MRVYLCIQLVEFVFQRDRSHPSVKLIEDEREMTGEIVWMWGADREVWTDGRTDRPCSVSTV